MWQGGKGTMWRSVNSSVPTHFFSDIFFNMITSWLGGRKQLTGYSRPTALLLHQSHVYRTIMI